MWVLWFRGCGSRFSKSCGNGRVAVNGARASHLSRFHDSTAAVNWWRAAGTLAFVFSVFRGWVVT